ncbi:MAG: hypothetical protein IJK60_10750 [Clostridia bacterium]|nr:hypothetical protein [Clostridia bacterium]
MAKGEGSSKKKLTWREYNLILTVLGIALVLAAYFLGYSKYSEKNTELEGEIGTRSAYLSELNDCYNNLATYEAGIADAKKNISDNLAKLPVSGIDANGKKQAGINDEDFLLYLMEANRSVGADLQTVDFQSSSLMAQFDCYVGDEVKKVTGYRTGTTSTGVLTYNQLKDYLRYIYERTNNTTFVDSISIAYEAETARLNSSVSLSKYYVDYADSDYSAPAVPNVPIGTGNPFGTANAPATTAPATTAPATTAPATTAAPTTAAPETTAA